MTRTPRLGRGSNRCGICNRRRSVVGWCDECRKSYDRMTRTSDDTVLTTVMWAVRRARRFAIAAALTLVACGPVADHRGEAGQHCKPDGSCISERLECVDAPAFWGLPAEAEPSCRMKVKP